MAHGRKHFHEGLRSEAVALVYQLHNEQLTHAEYLDRRSTIMEGRAYARSTASAKRECLAFLHGAEEMLHATRAIVWRHRLPDGTWVPSPLPAGMTYDDIDPGASRHVWASTNKAWFEPTEAPC